MNDRGGRSRGDEISVRRLFAEPVLVSAAPTVTRIVFGTTAGVWIGAVFAIVGAVTEPSIPWARLLVSNVLGGAIGGGTYGVLAVVAKNRIGAGLAMGVAATAGVTVAFYGWQVDFWPIGWLWGVSAGLTFAVLMWKPAGGGDSSGHPGDSRS